MNIHSLKINIEKKFSQNFYFIHFKSDVATAKLYFWFFENKVTLDDFEVFEKRHYHGVSLFVYILQYLEKIGVTSLSISSRDSSEAQKFWKELTQKEYTSHQFEQIINIKETLLYLTVESIQRDNIEKIEKLKNKYKNDCKKISSHL